MFDKLGCFKNGISLWAKRIHTKFVDCCELSICIRLGKSHQNTIEGSEVGLGKCFQNLITVESILFVCIYLFKKILNHITLNMEFTKDCCLSCVE